MTDIHKLLNCVTFMSFPKTVYHFATVCLCGLTQSRTQSPQALWPAVSLQERLWGHRILLPQDFCGKTMETVTEQPIKKIEIFQCPQSLSWRPPADQKA